MRKEITIEEEEKIYEFYKSNTLPLSVVAKKCAISVPLLRKIVSRYEKGTRKTKMELRFERHAELLQKIEPELVAYLIENGVFDIYKEGFIKGYTVAEVDLLSRKKR